MMPTISTNGSRFFQGKFIPKNPEKYIGKNLQNIQYRSGWELAVMTKLDEHPNVIGWASEAVSVPYKNPLTGKTAMYIPDFLIAYLDKNGQRHFEMMEVKPLKETPGYIRENANGTKAKVSAQTKLIQIVNAAKWDAAIKYCALRKWRFRVASEDQLFAYKRK